MEFLLENILNLLIKNLKKYTHIKIEINVDNVNLKSVNYNDINSITRIKVI